MITYTSDVQLIAPLNEPTMYSWCTLHITLHTLKLPMLYSPCKSSTTFFSTL